MSMTKTLADWSDRKGGFCVLTGRKEQESLSSLPAQSSKSHSLNTEHISILILDSQTQDWRKDICQFIKVYRFYKPL